MAVNWSLVYTWMPHEKHTLDLFPKPQVAKKKFIIELWAPGSKFKTELRNTEWVTEVI